MGIDRGIISAREGSRGIIDGGIRGAHLPSDATTATTTREVRRSPSHAPSLSLDPLRNTDSNTLSPDHRSSRDSYDRSSNRNSDRQSDRPSDRHRDERDSRSNNNYSRDRNLSPDAPRTGERSPPPAPRASLPDAVQKKQEKRPGEQPRREGKGKANDQSARDDSEAAQEDDGMEEEGDEDAEAAAMAAMFGFAGFGTTKVSPCAPSDSFPLLIWPDDSRNKCKWISLRSQSRNRDFIDNT